MRATQQRTITIDGTEYSLPTHVYWRPSSRCFEYKAIKRAVQKQKLFGEEYPDVDAAYRAVIAYAKKTDKPTKAKVVKQAAVITGSIKPKPVAKSAAKPIAPTAPPVVVEEPLPEITSVTCSEVARRLKVDLALVNATIRALGVKHDRVRQIGGVSTKLYNAKKLGALVLGYQAEHDQILAERTAQRKAAVAQAADLTQPEKLIVVLNDIGNAMKVLYGTVNQLVQKANTNDARDERLVGMMESIMQAANGNSRTLTVQMNRMSELTARLEMRLGLPAGEALGAAFAETMGKGPTGGGPSFSAEFMPQSGVTPPAPPEVDTKVTAIDAVPPQAPVEAPAPTPLLQKGIEVKLATEPAPVPAPKPVLKKVAIVGLHPNQVVQVQRKFGDKFDLQFFSSEEAHGKGFRARLLSCATVYALMSNLNHGIDDLRSGAGKNLVALQGGTSGLVTEMTKHALGQVRSELPIHEQRD